MNSVKYLFVIGLIVPLILLVACSPAVEIGGAGEDPSISTDQGDSGKDQLIIYSGRSESLVQPIIDQFEEATGIDVQVRYGSTMEMAGVLLEEGANSPADIFYAQDPGGLGALQSAGLLAPLPEAIIGKVPSRFASAEGDWVGISGRARTVVYNVDAISDPESELPQDLFGFVDPQWDGRIGWAPTNGSFQAMVTAMRVTWGDEKTAEWLQGIQANHPVVYPQNTPIVAGTAAGEVDVGFVNHYYLHRFLAEEGEDFPARNYFLPGGDPGSLIMVSGAGVLKSAQNVDNAEKFLAFLLSIPGQQYFASQTFEYPVIDGVAIAHGLPDLTELDALAIDIPPADLADIQGTQDLLLELGIID